MSDKQKAVAALRHAISNCKDALDTLSSGHIPRGAGASIDIIRDDFLSLLALLHASCTKAALVLNPTRPAHKASLPPLQDIAGQTSALSHCVGRLCEGHGQTFRHEIESIAKDVLVTVSSLLQSFLENEERIAGGDDKKYLLRTGTIHEIIDKARAPGGTSRDNLSAVHKKWQLDHPSLVDAYDEVVEMCSARNTGVEATSEGDTPDDDWAELGLGSNIALSAQEVERAKKVNIIVRISNLMHQQVSNDLLSTKLSRRDLSTLKSANHQLDTLAKLSSALQIATDDLVSSLYSPQDPENIKATLSSFNDTAHQIESAIIQAFFTVPQGGSLNASFVNDDKIQTEKWFKTCFNQIFNTIQSLDNDL